MLLKKSFPPYFLKSKLNKYGDSGETHVISDFLWTFIISKFNKYLYFFC